jgi:D-alanyl-D-alanine endopeptidase (penicillin-binding protein 7)
MKATLHKPLFLIALLLVLLTFSNVVSSSREPEAATVATPTLSVSGEPGAVTASAYAVFVVESGTILASANTAEVLPIASVTKLATAAAIMQSPDIETETTITYTDLLAEGRAGKLEIGEKHTLRGLLFPLLLESSNDAAAVYERVTSNGVITDMNNFAKGAGMLQTNFTDASGLSDTNVSTVSDLVTFTRHLVSKYPAVLDITRLKAYVGPYTGLINNSPVIERGYQGGKHGYTYAAGRTLVAVFEEPLEGGSVSIGYVILGSDNLAADTETLRAFVRDSVRFE